MKITSSPLTFTVQKTNKENGFLLYLAHLPMLIVMYNYHINHK
mgnify:CR=1 FL=1